MLKIMIKELKKDFTGIGQVKGFEFSQINCTMYGFLYKVNTGDSIYYEVFKKRLNTQYNNISYPTNKAFGIWAWTTPNLSKAIDILNSFEKVD
jgi:hypothetical protein